MASVNAVGDHSHKGQGSRFISWLINIASETIMSGVVMSWVVMSWVVRLGL